MELTAGLDFVRGREHGVLGTIAADGRPQISNIIYRVDEADVIRISVTDSRAKTRNLRRDPRASLYVVGDNFWRWVVLEADAELSPVASSPDDATVDELVALYRSIRGEEHPDWDEYRRAMCEEGRLVVRLRPTRAYGLLGG